MKGLVREISISRSLRRCGERGVSHGVEHSNDFIYRVVSRTNCYLLVIRVRDHISKIHIVENALIVCEQDSDGSDGGFRYLYGSILSNVPLVSKPWISME